MKKISFTDQMIRAIRGGRKTQTRRPVKTECFTNPYGQPGDKLSVQWTDIILKIVNIHAERLHDIDTAGANSEGVACSDCWTADTPYSDFPHDDRCACRNVFISLWQSIYEGSKFDWYRNPWVWVIEFEMEVAG